MTVRNYKRIKYLSLVVYPAIVLELLVEFFLKIDDTDKEFVLYLAIGGLCIWLVLFILTARKVLWPAVSGEHHNSYLIVLGIFHVVPIYSTFVLLSGIIKGEEQPGWEIAMVTALNVLFILNFFRADTSPDTQ